MQTTHDGVLTPPSVKAVNTPRRETTIVYEITSKKTGNTIYSMDWQYTQERQKQGDRIKALVFKPIPKYGVY